MKDIAAAAPSSPAPTLPAPDAGTLPPNYPTSVPTPSRRCSAPKTCNTKADIVHSANLPPQPPPSLRSSPFRRALLWTFLGVWDSYPLPRPVSTKPTSTHPARLRISALSLSQRPELPVTGIYVDLPRHPGPVQLAGQWRRPSRSRSPGRAAAAATPTPPVFPTLGRTAAGVPRPCAPRPPASSPNGHQIGAPPHHRAATWIIKPPRHCPPNLQLRRPPPAPHSWTPC